MRMPRQNLIKGVKSTSNQFAIASQNPKKTLWDTPKNAIGSGFSSIGSGFRSIGDSFYKWWDPDGYAEDQEKKAVEDLKVKNTNRDTPIPILSNTGEEEVKKIQAILPGYMSTAFSNTLSSHMRKRSPFSGLFSSLINR